MHVTLVISVTPTLLSIPFQEGLAMKGEIARLKMELGLIIQAQKESERNVVVSAA